jgi:membrane-associated phospholipid phosphatase
LPILLALVVACIAGLASALLVTAFWKISIHIAAVADAVVILVIVLGLPLTALASLVALTAWARVTLRDHTPAQIIAGGALGAIVAGVVFTVAR